MNSVSSLLHGKKKKKVLSNPNWKFQAFSSLATLKFIQMWMNKFGGCYIRKLLFPHNRKEKINNKQVIVGGDMSR